MDRTRLESVISALALVALAGAARGQDGDDEGPIIVGEKRGQWETFELKSVSAELGFEERWQRDEYDQTGAPDTTDTSNLLRGTFDLFTESYIGHKNFIDLTATLGFGVDYEQVRSDTADQDRDDITFSNLYDISALILGEGPLPVIAYSRRDETFLDREFSGSIRSITSETGVIFRLKSERAPTTVQYFHRDQSDSDTLDIVDTQIVQDTVVVQSLYRITESQELELTYIFDHVDETQAFGFQNMYDRHDATLTHTLRFGPEDKHDLRSMLRLYDQSGRYAGSVVRLDEQLTLRHTEDLESRYNLIAETQDRGGSDQQLIAGNAQVRHQLYDSLTSTATVGGDHLSLADDDFTSDGYFVAGTLDYVKRVPYGLLEASSSVGYDRQENSDRGDTLSVVNQPAIFIDPLPIILNRRNIVPSSILVTGAAGIPVFQEGLDYDVRDFPDRVELRRVVGGAIPNGTSVLISYDIGPEPENAIDTINTSFSVRYQFDQGALDGLAAYFRYRRTDRNLDADDTSLFVIEDVNVLIYGLEYEISDFTFGAERENRDSNVSGYDATRLFARYQRRLAPRSSITADLTYEIFDYTTEDNKLELLRASARWRHRLSRNLDISLWLQYRDEQEDISGDTRGFEQAVELNWQLRQTSAYMTLRNAILEGDNVDRLSQEFVIGFRRRF